MYLTTARLLNLDPADCLVVEDHPHGIQSAEAAGCPVLVVDSPNDVNLANIQAGIRHTERMLT